MPIYEYQCKGCCHCFEHLKFRADEPDPDCPECRCGNVEKLMSAGCLRTRGIAKGSGGFGSKTACKPAGWGFDRIRLRLRGLIAGFT